MKPTSARLEARLLGGFDLRRDGHPVDIPSRPARSLLAYLLTTGGTMHRREKLAAMFWPDSDEENGRSYLRHALWRIRKALAREGDVDGAFIRADEFSVGFDPAADHWLDVAEFEQGEDGADLYRGELLPGVLDEWALLERDRLEALLPAKMQRLIDRLSAEQRWVEVIERAERWIAFGGAPEGAYRALMTAHASLGDRAAVATAYRRCVEALKRDLDVGPSDQTRELYATIAAGGGEQRAPAPADVRAAPTPAGPETSPFKGLQHFDEADAALFFGRDAIVAAALDRLRAGSFLALIGASGSGKSSIARAGIVPALRAAGRLVHVMTPTAHPLEALAVGLTARARSTAATAALVDDLARDPRSLRLHLRRTRSRPVLVIDQFEELFALCRDAFEREAFLDNLLMAAFPSLDATATVVITLRADFYTHCSDHAALRDAIAQDQLYIGPMGRAELREAIERPAALGGWSLERGLSVMLLEDVGDEPGALPLLSHALLETWRRRRDRTLTLEGYAASGRVRGAIARTAESVYERLSGEDQRSARRIFLRLTEFGEGTQDTRRRASATELAARDGGTAEAVVKVLADARLLTISGDSIEVAHEALIREWPRLRGWLDDDRESLRVQREVGRAAREWDCLGRDAGALYRGARLAQASELLRQRPDELNDLERDFVAASLDLSDREEREREAVRQRELESAHRLAAIERQATTRLRRRALYLTFALLFLTGMAGAAVYFAEQARASASAAALEQQRALLESARAAAVNVDARLGAIREGISPVQLREQLIRLHIAEDRDLPATLAALRMSLGADMRSLFLLDYLNDEVVGIAPPFSRAQILGPLDVPEPYRRRVEVARAALREAIPDAPRGCAALRATATPGIAGTALSETSELNPLRTSAPYSYGGEQPSIAIAQFNQPCRPYAIVVEVSLRRAHEWLAVAIGPDDDAYLVDGTGRLLAQARRPDTDFLRGLATSDLVRHALASQEPFVREADDPIHGGSRLAAAADVGDLGWKVIVARRSSAAGGQLDAALARLTALGALMALLLVVVAGSLLLTRRRAASGSTALRMVTASSSSESKSTVTQEGASPEEPTASRR